MPPKKNAAKGGKVDKQKAKIIEDKTFGLKNKNKSSKVNKYVQQVQQQVMNAGNPKKQKEGEEKRNAQMTKKQAEEAKKAELAELFKPVQIQQKIPFGVDPKTVLCAFFKQGQCQKGTKCKFSHDVNIERKGTKIDLYTDARDDQNEDTMDKWDQDKLESVVAKRHNENNLNKPTEIVCKYFLEAIETQKYGWFWQCVNGDNCKYRHALPPGYVLKKKETEEERREREEREKENEITIEEFLETERHKLGSNLTPVTLESFTKWKEERKARQKADEEAELKRKEEAYKQYKSGKAGMQFSGRELFDFNPEWANAGDDDAMDVYEREPSEHGEDDEEEKQKQQQEAGPSHIPVAEELFEEDLEGLDIDDDDDDDDEDA